MPAWLQNLLALTLVAACGLWAARQAVRSLRGKRSRLGSCCDKGCGAAQTKPAAGPVQFLPSDLLKRR
jgi:hypothetical protein